jgi:hypothetical protein
MADAEDLTIQMVRSYGEFSSSLSAENTQSDVLEPFAVAASSSEICALLPLVAISISLLFRSGNEDRVIW